MLYLLTSSNSFPHQKIEKVRVINLTQGAGLKAMEELAKLEEERETPGYAAGGKGILADERKRQNRAGKNGGELSVVTSGKSGRIASNEMCTFLILNISSLQLIPVNMIAYRQQYGSVNPAGIIAPAIVATFISTLVAVVGSGECESPSLLCRFYIRVTVISASVSDNI